MGFPSAGEYETLDSVIRSNRADEPETTLAAVNDNNGPTGPEACLELPDLSQVGEPQELWQTKL